MDRQIDVPNDGITWSAPIHKEEVLVVKPAISEPPSFVEPLAEPDNGGHMVSSEVREVELRSVERVAWRRARDIT